MYYTEQVVALRGARMPAIFLGYDSDDADKVWIYAAIELENSDKGTTEICYDIMQEDQSDITHIHEASKNTVTGTKTYYGPLCKLRYGGLLDDDTINKREKLYMKEIKKMLKWKAFTEESEVESYKKGK